MMMNVLFLVLGDVDDADADGFCADGIEGIEGVYGGGDLGLQSGVGGDDDRDGIVGAAAFVLEDA